VVARAGGGDPPGPGGARHRPRPLQPARPGLPDRQDRCDHDLRQHRFPHHGPRFTPEARKANQALVDLLASIARRKDATPAQIALAWLLSRKPWIVPIPGTTKLHRLQENVAAAAVALTAEDLRDIESAAARITVQGHRYSESAQRMVDR